MQIDQKPPTPPRCPTCGLSVRVPMFPGDKCVCPKTKAMTLKEAREIVRPLGWKITGNSRIGYTLVALPGHGDYSTGPFDTPADAVREAIITN